MKGVIPLAGSLLVFTWLCTGSVQGLQCYTCSYADMILDTDVFEDYIEHDSDWYRKSCHTSRKPDDKFLSTCREDQTCAKIAFTGTHSKKKTEVIATVRGCVRKIEKLSGKCKDYSSTVSVCFCDSDRCNNASNMLPTFYGLVASLISIFIVGKIM